VVAALLLMSLVSIAAAAENLEHQSKNAQKLIATLDSVGINDQDVKNFITETDSHVDHGYLYLSQEKVMGGNLALRYQLGSMPSSRHVELNFTPEDAPHIQLNARTDMVRVGYHLDFP